MSGLFSLGNPPVGLTTVAEGVEQEAQLERLMDMGCDLVQGFMFAPPLKEDALFRLMQTGFAHLPVFGGAVA